MRTEKRLLSMGISMPIVYFPLLFIAGALYPDFSHIRQVPSDLGAVGAPYEWAAAFNIGLDLVGVMGVLGGIGLFFGLRKLDVGKTLALFTGASIVLPSINMLMSGIFPLPSPYHSIPWLLLPAFFAPLLGALVLRRLPDLKYPVVILLIGFSLNLVVFAGMMGLAGFVTDENLGLWIRIWAAIVFPAMGYICWTVRSKV